MIPTGVRLDIEKQGLQALLSWPGEASGWTLYYLEAPFTQWKPFPTAPTLTEGEFRVFDPMVDPVRLYRLTE